MGAADFNEIKDYGGKASAKRSARQSNLGVENPIVGVLISPVPRGAECGQRHRVPSLLGGDERATHNPIAEVSIAITENGSVSHGLKHGKYGIFFTCNVFCIGTRVHENGDDITP